MIIQSVRLHNIRSYVDERISFPTGSCLLSGDIGSGKSTILLAIEFSLFGAKRGSGELLLRHGSREGSVEASLLIDEKKVHIKRSLKRMQDGVKQDSGYIIVDGTKKEGTPVELKAEVLSLLGYPRDMISKSKDTIYRFTVYTPQEEMNAILADESETRMETLRRVFGIDRYKTIALNAWIVLRHVKDQRKFLMKDAALGELTQRKLELLGEIERFSKKIAEVEPQVKAVKAVLMACREEERKTSQELQQFLFLQKTHEIRTAGLIHKTQLRDETLAELNRLDSETEALQKQITTLPSEDAQSARQQKEAEILEFREKKARLEEQKSQLQARIASPELGHIAPPDISILREMQGSLGVKISMRRGYETELRGVQAELKDIQNAIAEVTVLEKRARETLNLQSMAICPLCRQTLSHQHKENVADMARRGVAEAQKQLEDLREKENLIQARVNAAEAFVREALSAVREHEQVSERLKSAQALLDQISLRQAESVQVRNQLTSIIEQLEKLPSLEPLECDLADLRQKERAYALKSQYQLLVAEKARRKQAVTLRSLELQESIQKLNNELLDLKEKLNLLEGVEQKSEDLKKKIEEMRQTEKKLELEEQGYHHHKASSERLLSLVEKDIAAKEEAQAKAEKLGRVQEWIEKAFLPLMQSMEKHVLLSIYTEFNCFFQDWFATLIEDDRLSVRLDDSFSPVIEQNGFETTFDHLSGGEKTSCSLAYRLSLNKVINDMVGGIKTKDIIILDEPTDGFSAEQLDRVRDVLDQIGVKQVILVSHESKIESFVDYVIRIEKEEHISRVST